VFFGGAGVSTESGVPDFRGAGGLYSQMKSIPPEILLSREYFLSNTLDFFNFYKEKMISADAGPNPAHKALAFLEKEGKLKAVVTQNIDGLHQMAGGKTVFELHGSVHRNYCMDCGAAYGLDKITGSAGIPYCKCGGIIKPDVVLYGETLDNGVIAAAAQAIIKADMLVVGGTSLSVYPAAGLVDYYSGNRLVLINQSPTRMDSSADLLIRGKVGETLGAAVNMNGGDAL